MRIKEFISTEDFISTWKEYEENFNNLVRKDTYTVPVSLNLFHNRLRLLLDLDINLVTKYSDTKTEDVKKSYIVWFELLHLWDLYEALIKFAEETGGGFTNNERCASRKFTKTFLKEISAYLIIEKAVNQIKTEFYENNQYAKEFNFYLQDRLLTRTTGRAVREDINSFYDYMNGKKTELNTEILSLIYAERNLSYHECQPARFGIYYGRRIRLISFYTECLLNLILKIANYIIKEEFEGKIKKSSNKVAKSQ